MMTKPACHSVLEIGRLILAWLYVFMLLFSIGMLVWWSIDNEPPRVVLHGAISPKQVNPGDTVTVTWLVKGVRSGCVGSAIRTLEGDCGAYLLYSGEMANRDLQVGQPYKLTINFSLPLTATPGRCEYHTTLYQACNPLQKLFPIKEKFMTLIFYVNKASQ